MRSSFFCQSFSENFLADPVLRGEFAFAAGNVKEPFIDVEDIANVAAAALIEDRHVGQLYEVTGPRLLTFAEAVEEIAKATGCEILRAGFIGRIRVHDVGARSPCRSCYALVQVFASVLDGRNAS